ncbi:hypothetical protein LJR098_001111 [Rhizobium sp. LjRoot98]|uniref:hypothetical protein n=1 Tax=Rhizobium sp. LjRoot98 TaxID=3342345 RepID=UPI003ECCC855
MAKTGTTPDGKIFIFQDNSIPGFQLRVQGKKAAWIVRTPAVTITIGYAWPDNDPKSPYIVAMSKVRDLAKAVVRYLEDGKTHWVKQLISTYHRSAAASKEKNDKGLIKRVLQEIEVAINAPPKVDIDTWTFGECVSRTISDKRTPGNKNYISESTEKDYHLTFGRPAFEEMLKKPAVLLTPGDIEDARDAIQKASGVSAALKAVTYSRAVLDYCTRTYSKKTGLDQGRPWWRMVSAQWEITPRDREPSIEDIVKSVILAEEYLDKPLPGRIQGVNGTNAGTLAGLWWLILTCQRADAGLSLLAHDVVQDPEDGNFVLVAWAADVMKAGMAHALPVPKRAWAMVDHFRKQNENLTAEGQEWAFPSEKKSDVHVTQSGVYRVLYRLAARDKPEKPRAAAERKPNGRGPYKLRERTEIIDLFALNGILWWSPHDLRRALNTCLDLAGMPGGTTVILAHDIHETDKLGVNPSERQREDFQRLRTARVTKLAYGGAQYIKLKKEGMLVWTTAILDEYDRQKGLASFKEAAE